MINESNVNNYASVFPTEFETAEGDMLTDHRGKNYLDFFCGASVLNYGHNNPKLKRAAISFLERNAVVHCLDMDTRIKRTFLEKFLSIILKPRGLNYKVQFPGPTGTNAVEAAIKLARIVTKRRKVISFTNSFHGMTATSLSLSASHEEDHKNIPSQDVAFFPFDQFLGDDINTIGYLEKMILTKGSGLELPAAVIVETVQAEGGVIIAGNKWLQDLRTFTRENNILLIIDDIQVGCGRTGNFFSFERAGIVPDIVLLSKSISGYGLPLSLLLIKPEFDVWKAGEHNGTFRSNNLSLCTASEALDFWEGGMLEKSIAEKAARIRHRLDGLVNKSADVIAVRGIGMIWGIEFSNSIFTDKIAKKLFNQGLLIETCGNNGQVLKLLPPLTIFDRNLEMGLDMIVGNILQHEVAGDISMQDNSLVAL